MRSKKKKRKKILCRILIWNSLIDGVCYWHSNLNCLCVLFWQNKVKRNEARAIIIIFIRVEQGIHTQTHTSACSHTHTLNWKRFVWWMISFFFHIFSVMLCVHHTQLHSKDRRDSRECQSNASAYANSCCRCIRNIKKWTTWETFRRRTHTHTHAIWMHRTICHARYRYLVIVVLLLQHNNNIKECTSSTSYGRSVGRSSKSQLSSFSFTSVQFLLCVYPIRYTVYTILCTIHIIIILLHSTTHRRAHRQTHPSILTSNNK